MPPVFDRILYAKTEGEGLGLGLGLGLAYSMRSKTGGGNGLGTKLRVVHFPCALVSFPDQRAWYLAWERDCVRMRTKLENGVLHNE